MATAIIVGDGPAGLSAALFLAKNGVSTTVIGQDETWVHKARLLNYLGIPAVDGPEFQRIARKQVTDMGATLHDGAVKSVARAADGSFAVELDDGERHTADYLVLATGPTHDLAQSLGLTKQGKAIVADRDGRTTIDKLYCIGWLSRPDKIQAIISAGDGAAAALDILSRERGKAFHDFDSL
jgi:thioredoxin reductase